MIKTEVVRSELHKEKQQQKHYYDKHAKQLTAFRPGQNVRVQIGKQWKSAVVTSVPSEPISYNIQTPNGQTYQRNIKSSSSDAYF